MVKPRHDTSARQDPKCTVSVCVGHTIRSARPQCSRKLPVHVYGRSTLAPCLGAEVGGGRWVLAAVRAVSPYLHHIEDRTSR